MCEKITSWLRTYSQPPSKPEDYITLREVALQTNLGLALPSSSDYKDTVTDMDVFARQGFAYRLTSKEAKTIFGVITNNMTKHAFLPTSIISKKESTFVSHVKQQAFWKSAWNIYRSSFYRLLNWMKEHTCHQKQALKIGTGEWILKYKTSYQSCNGCQHSWVFHGPLPYNLQKS